MRVIRPLPFVKASTAAEIAATLFGAIGILSFAKLLTTRIRILPVTTTNSSTVNTVIMPIANRENAVEGSLLIDWLMVVLAI